MTNHVTYFCDRLTELAFCPLKESNRKNFDFCLGFKTLVPYCRPVGGWGAEFFVVGLRKVMKDETKKFISFGAITVNTLGGRNPPLPPCK